MKANQDVTLRISTETSGDSGVRSLADEIDRLAESGGELAPQFRALAEEMRKIESTQGLVEAFAGLKKETAEAAVALEKAQQRAQALGREYAATTTPSRGLTAEFARARKEVTQAQSALQAKQQALQKMRGDLKAAGVDTKSLAESERRLREELVQLEQRGQIATQVLGEMGQEAQQTGAQVKQLAQDGESAGEAFARAGANFIAGTAALKGLQVTYGPAIQRSRDFGRSVAEISTLLDDTSEMPALAAGVRSLSREMGADVQSNAKALYDIISAGNSEAAGAMNVLTEANKLAIGGVTDVAVAADGLTSTLNAYQIEANRASEVSDAFFVAVKGGKTTVAELANGIGQVAPLAAQTGVELDQLLASVAALTTGGLKTAQAMTQVRAILTAVVKPSKEASDLAQELGLRFDLAALKSQGFASFLESVRAATGGNAEQMAVLLGSVEAINGALALTGNQASTFAGILENMAGKAGAAEAAFQKMMDGPDADIRRFNAALDDAQIALGNAVLAFSPLIEAATNTLNVFNEMPDGIKTTVAALGAVAVSAPVVLFALKSYVAAWQALRQAMTIGAVSSVARRELVATAATASAAAASMSRAAGSVGLLSRALGFLGGPIGLVLSAAALLVPAFMSTGDAAEKAAEGTGVLAEQLAEDAEAISEATEQIEEAQSERLTQERAFAARLAEVKNEETARLRAQLDAQVKAYREATKSIDAAIKAREAAEKRRANLAQTNKDFIDGLGQGGATKDRSSVDAQNAITKARGLAGQGDLEGAIKQAERAKQIVQQLDQSGQESAYVLQYLARQIAQVQDEAAAGLETEAAAAVEQERARAEQIQQLITETLAQAEWLKMLEVGFDQAGAEASAEQLRAALEAKLAANPIVIPAVVVDPISEDAATGRLMNDAPARAYGGPLPGSERGDRSDHVAYWGTPGEWVIQRPAVRKWGAANMHLINQGRMPRYAYGGEIGGSSMAQRASIPSVDAATQSGLPPLTGRPLVLPDGSQVPVYTDTRMEEAIVKLFSRAASQRGRRR